jgi:DNA-binding NarL/FixJ family response regulator
LKKAIHALAKKYSITTPERFIEFYQSAFSDIVNSEKPSRFFLNFIQSGIGHVPATTPDQQNKALRSGQDAAVSTKVASDCTEREREVINLVCQRFTTKEIATRLHISDSTVKNHLKSIFNKLGLCKRNQLVALYTEEIYKERSIAGLCDPGVNILN